MIYSRLCSNRRNHRYGHLLECWRGVSILNLFHSCHWARMLNHPSPTRRLRWLGLEVHSYLTSLSVYLCMPSSSHCKFHSPIRFHSHRPCHRGEMSSMYPVSGAFSIFGTRFVSPALGFTLGKVAICHSTRISLTVSSRFRRMELLAAMACFHPY